MTVEDWFLFSVPVTEGEDWDSFERKTVIGGIVFGHPTLPDKSFFISDGLVSGFQPSEVVSTESGAVFKLGKVAHSCEIIFPGIKENLLKSLPQDSSLVETPVSA